MSIFWQLTVKPAQVELVSELLQGKRKTKNLGYCRRMQGNRRNVREESDTIAISEPYTPLRKKQKLRNCTVFLVILANFSLIQCLLKFLFVQTNFHRECD